MSLYLCYAAVQVQDLDTGGWNSGLRALHNHRNLGDHDANQKEVVTEIREIICFWDRRERGHGSGTMQQGTLGVWRFRRLAGMTFQREGDNGGFLRDRYGANQALL